MIFSLATPAPAGHEFLSHLGKEAELMHQFKKDAYIKIRLGDAAPVIQFKKK